MADLYRDLPLTYGMPTTMSPHSGGDVQYSGAERMLLEFQKMKADGRTLAGQPITDLVTVNGARASAEDEVLRRNREVGAYNQTF